MLLCFCTMQPSSEYTAILRWISLLVRQALPSSVVVAPFIPPVLDMHDSTLFKLRKAHRLGSANITSNIFSPTFVMELSLLRQSLVCSVQLTFHFSFEDR